jgi:Cu-Zn family superoxide dismutase
MYLQISAVVLSVAAMAVMAQGAAADNGKPVTTSATASFTGLKGAPLGVARLLEGSKGVLITLELKGLEPGWHAIHLHETGKCTDEHFHGAGNHVMAGHEGHAATASLIPGLLNAKSNDSGALPNIYAGPDGRLFAELYSTYVSLGGAGGRALLLDADGASIVIHEKPEVHTGSVSTAGARVACGAIVASRPKGTRANPDDSARSDRDAARAHAGAVTHAHSGHAAEGAAPTSSTGR